MIFMGLPGPRVERAVSQASLESIGAPSTETTTSPGLTPARSAGERTITLTGQAPPPGVGMRILREQLGISVRQGRGALVITVTERGSAAANAGLETGDTLLALNNTQVKTTEDVDNVLKRDYNRSTLSMEVGRGRFAYNLSFPLD